MIGNFYPFMVTAAVNTGASFSTVNVRSTSAATELTNNIEWWMTYD